MAHFLPSNSNLGGRAGAAALGPLAGGEPALVFSALRSNWIIKTELIRTNSITDLNVYLLLQINI